MTTISDPIEQTDDIPTYEQALRAQMGASALERIREAVGADQPYGDARTALKVGDIAPPFNLADMSGQAHTLSALLAHGPVVVIFYRGGWCPFCNLQLRVFQLARPRLRALGANVVLISPQRAALAQSLAERHAIQFPLLVDEGNRVAREYGLVFQLEAAQRNNQLAQGVDLTAINGDTRWELPMPATFVIDPAGTIRYAFVSADYTRRSESADVFAALHAMRR